VNLAEVSRGLRRRWYIVIPGLLLAVAAAVGAWFVVDPGYERTATQLLLPGARSMPEEGNPFLFLGGLTNAADVLVRAVGSENVQNEIEEEHPGVEVEVTRDGSTAGPVILITVTAATDTDAEVVLETLVARTSEVLEQLQVEEGIAAENRMTVLPVTIDETSVPQQRDRYLAVALAGIGVALLAVLAASLVDGLVLQRRRRGASAAADDADGGADPAGSDSGLPADAFAADTLPADDFPADDFAADDFAADDRDTDAPRAAPHAWAPEPSRKHGRWFVPHFGAESAHESGESLPPAESESPPPPADEPVGDASHSGQERSNITRSR
jgi:hypothetical protein